MSKIFLRILKKVRNFQNQTFLESEPNVFRSRTKHFWIQNQTFLEVKAETVSQTFQPYQDVFAKMDVGA